jgi:transposase-like protein
MRSPRLLSKEEKEALVRRLEAGERVAVLAAETGVLRKSLYEWRAAYRALGAAGLNRKRGPKPGLRAAVDPSSADAGPPAARPPDELARAKARVAELERLVGRQQADLDFFREALRSWDAKRRGSGAPISSPSSKK